jgi:hypothetical protein
MKQALLDLARLVRLPNVFTAMADICLGAVVTGSLPDRLISFLFLLLTSTCLYWAGMVWNDYFDVEQDKRERPARPLASGRIGMATAFRIGSLFMILGLAFSALADWQNEGQRALPLAILLGLAILSYDGWLKRTWAGPVMMGTCRFLNILLGLSIAAQPTAAWGVALALAVGLYIVGVTWFARTEARLSNQQMLIVGAAFMLAGVLMTLTVPPLARTAGLAPNTAFLFPYLLAAFGIQARHSRTGSLGCHSRHRLGRLGRLSLGPAPGPCPFPGALGLFNLRINPWRICWHVSMKVRYHRV